MQIESSLSEPVELRAAARQAWSIAAPEGKIRATLALQSAQPLETRPIEVDRVFEDALRPGRPALPRLVHPRDVPQRGVGSAAGRAALLHAIAHIEFNAVDLALDALWRFAGMSPAWYADWLSVACDEARHFSMLSAELTRRGFAYGDFDAHDGLWEMALRTRDDPLERMALVPRLMEARGLDVTPLIMSKLEQANDLAAVEILAVILREEVGHVAIGNRWYTALCAERGLDPALAWNDLAARHGASPPRGPLNEAARLQAGFTPQELQAWR